MMAASAGEIWNQLRAQLAADKKKSGVLAALLLVLLVALGRLCLTGDAPVAVDAATLIPPATAAPAPTRPALVRPTPEPLAATASPSTAAVAGEASAMEAASAPAFDAASRTARVAIDGLPRMPNRDLFVTPEWHRFSPAIIADAPMAGGKMGKRDPGGFWASLSRRIAEHERERSRELHEIERTLGELELQSTLTGPDALAHISGHLVRPGDRIRGFLVVEIGDRRVTLSKSGVIRQLSMP